MKMKILLTATLTGLFLLVSGTNHVWAQGTKAPSKIKVGPAATAAKTDIPELKGEYLSKSSCVDMIVKQGCVSYTILPAAEGDVMAMPQQKSVRVCFDPKDKAKPTNICPKGASRFKVAYEKADKATMVEFMPTKTK